MRATLGKLIGAALVLTGAASARAGAETPAPAPARLKVSGYGFWGNRELQRALRLLQPGERAPEHYDANFIEDGALVLLSRLARDGHQEPQLTVDLTLADGQRLTHQWDRQFETLLPRPLAARRVQFRLQPGVRQFYQRVDFTGLRHLKTAEARRFFFEDDFLIPLRNRRIYTPERAERALGSLTETLARRGFPEATARVERLDRDDRTGAVRLGIAVEEGPRSIVRSVRVEEFGPDAAAPVETRLRSPNAPYSPFWEQDFLRELQAEQYRRGRPDARAEIAVERRDVTAAEVRLDLVARVFAGPEVRVGEVKFEGQERTRESVLQRAARLREGALLDRTETERARQRLARLGIFQSVDLRYETVDERTRDVIYELDEGRVMDFSLLFGYGSYELFRGGFELEQFNLFGRGHQHRLRAMQSFKATSGDYLYSLPELFGENLTVFFNAAGLRRQEINFDREEYGGGVGGQRHVRALAADVGLRYKYEFLNARDTGVTLPPGVERARVSSFVLDVKHDRRDNPLSPRRGFRLFTTVEAASAALGGEVDFQRIEVGTSFHQRLGGGRYLHLGLSHGAALTLGGADRELPFNKRFFPGGESSVRGYQQGEASPRNAAGELIGAETYLLGNVEFEQVLTPAWSLVAFVDGVGFAADIREYPVRHSLFSAGGGVRWKTIIGPARLEYGHNLNPRRGDPRGTLHLSVGFPF